MKREYPIEVPYNPRTPLPRRIKEAVQEIQRQVGELGYDLLKVHSRPASGHYVDITPELRFRGFGPGIARYELVDHGGRSGVFVRGEEKSCKDS